MLKAVGVITSTSLILSNEDLSSIALMIIPESAFSLYPDLPTVSILAHEPATADPYLLPVRFGVK